MDKLTIFGNNISAEETTQANSDEILEKILNELKLTRRGHEEWDWEHEVEEDIDLEDDIEETEE